MSELASAEKLREGVLEFAPNIRRKVCMALDEIEREVSERYMLLPVDADGVPIHVGDRLDNFGEKFTCEWIEYDTDNVSVGYAIGDGELPPAFAPDECEHIKPRTIEDVLCDMIHEYGSTDALTETIAAKYATVLRGMMEADE